MAVLKYTCDSRAVLMDRGETPYLPRLSLHIRKDSTLHNLGFKWIYEVLSNYIVLKPLCYADLGQQEAQSVQLFLGIFPLLCFNQDNNNAKQSINVKSGI